MIREVKKQAKLNSNLLLVRKIIQYNKTPNNTINSEPKKTKKYLFTNYVHLHLHLADAFIQSDLHCIQVTVLHFISSCFPWEQRTMYKRKGLKTKCGKEMNET